MGNEYFNMAVSFFKNMYIKIFKPFLINIFAIFDNFKKGDYNKVFIFIASTFIIFILIQVQIMVGIIFLLYYCVIFLLFYFLSIPYVLNYAKLPFNFRYLIRHTIFNLVVLLPRAKAFLYFYNISSFLIKKEYKKIKLDIQLTVNIILIIILVVSFYYFFKMFLLVFGFSYLSLFISSHFVNQLFLFLDLKYSTLRAKIQHLIINCIINFDSSIGYVSELFIILKYDDKGDFIIIYNI